MPTTPALAALHPLTPLSGEEIIAARDLVFASRRAQVTDDVVRFAYVALCEPPKDTVHAIDRGEDVVVDRRVRLVLLQGPEADVVESIVSVTRGEIDRWEVVRDVRPPLQIEESIHVLAALHEHPEWSAALDRRGIVDRSLVQIDPWPAGTFGLGHEEGRRITRCLAFLRESPEDNGYARPLEGLSFEVAGNLVRWQKWSLRVGMDPLEGLVLHTMGYEDGGRVRPVLYRAAVSEMVVPYGHPGPMHAWKSAFDAGEWGLGRMANSLTIGCDCLGEIHYFDNVWADEKGKPHTRRNAICMHEEDYGILWKHVDMVSGRSEVRRSRRLVVSSIATVGNYEYGFYWYFYLDGTMQLEVKLTGIMSTMAVADGDAGEHAKMVAPGLAAPYHQHLFNVRLDVEVDGPHNAVYEVDAVGSAAPGSPENPWGNVFGTTSTLLETVLAARRDVDPGRSRMWRIANRSMHNAVGEPTAYKLLPGSTPTLLAHPDSSVGRRAAFAAHNVWVTPFDPDERRAAGDYPNQHGGGAGLPEWTARDRPIVDTDIVVWHSFGVTHVPRPEDWPVMPVEYTGFSLVPFGFFERNPALDVPPSGDHCNG